MSKDKTLYTAVVESLEKVEKLKKTALAHRFSEDSATPITWDELNKTPFNQWIVLKGKGVRFMRVEHPDYEVYFITEMDPQFSDGDVAEFGFQVHDCKEIGEVLDGHLVELVENEKEYQAGDIFIYPISFRHKPVSYIKSKYGVGFINPNLNKSKSAFAKA